MKGGTQAIELKERLDKYYLESVAAKMHVLKDVILRDSWWIDFAIIFLFQIFQLETQKYLTAKEIYYSSSAGL